MQYISFSFSICCLLFLLTISFYYFSKKKVSTTENKIFSSLIITNLSLLIIDSGGFLIYNYSNVTETIKIIISKVYLIFYSLYGYIFIYYISLVMLPKEENITIAKKIIIFFSLLTSAATLLLPVKITYNNNMIMPTGVGVMCAYSSAIFLTIYSVVIIIMYANTIKMKIKKLIPIFCLLVFSSIAIVIQFYNPGITLLLTVDTIVTFIMYHTIENPDVKMLNEVSLAKDAAEKANHAKSDFLSNMSHEIRTPLNAIVGFSEALKYDDLPQESVEKVNDIIMASNNLLDIVNGILDISKIEANKLEIISKEYDIHSMLDELVSLTKARIGERNLEFKVNIDKSIPSVLYGDNTRIKQVVLNILTNAVKYTKEGYVDFRVSSVIKDNVCRLIFSVEDSGIGIKEEALPKLFSKFERLNVEKSLTIEGTGLGLAITKKLVELMDGKIIVQSVYGKGSKFTVSVDQRIIAVEKPETKEVKATESKAINANGARVLVVDDNDLNIKVASTLLKKYNFVIDSAHSGLECINKINKGEKYDIVFLDDMMPKMNGRETIKRLKSDDNYKIPTIALTANAITGMKEEYLSCGFDDYLSKPIEKTELERVIKTYIHKMNDEITNTPSGEVSSIIDMDFNIPDVVPRSMQKEVAKDNENALDFSDKKLLLVDDNELNLKVAEMSLKKYKFDITSVKSGSDCISKVIENKYDIIFLDDMMPDLDGCKTLDNLKTLEDFNTPVIMMTASPKDEVEKKIQEHGFNGYLGKPFKKEDLDDILNKELNK